MLFINISFVSSSYSQIHVPSDPYHLLLYEKSQFDGEKPMNSNMFRPLFHKTDSTLFMVQIKNEFYFNDNVPNQENMDVRYFSKGMGSFNSIALAMNSKYFTFLAEPYIINNNFLSVNSIDREGSFSVLNDKELPESIRPESSGFRNFLAFIHYKGFGFGWNNGNKWWGGGVHSGLQMTNNTKPFPSQIIGTIHEIRFGNIGLYGLYSFSKINESFGENAKYFTSLNGQISWYGSAILSVGFSRNYLTGGRKLLSGYEWKEADARKIVFEGLFTSDLLDSEYTVGGHDAWDQTLSGYINVTLPERDLKLYAEFGFNDNRMYFADFLSQPDHSMATVIGVRDYGIGANKNWIWGAEWTNLMITYTSRHRTGGPGTWYQRNTYQFSSYYGRRWGAHSGSDSDDWYIYMGYLSDRLMIIPALNYERHGIVTHRPAEVKMELRLDARYKYNGTWIGLYYEKQQEAFLGFPDYFYEDDMGNPIDASKGNLANSRATNTLILTISRIINF
tara:strand:- start:6388 stop:7899 length:1512 start_codon:yes stop_codon:yes gene_type:complete